VRRPFARPTWCMVHCTRSSANDARSTWFIALATPGKHLSSEGERRATGDGRRVTGDGRRATGDGRRATGDGGGGSRFCQYHRCDAKCANLPLTFFVWSFVDVVTCVCAVLVCVEWAPLHCRLASRMISLQARVATMTAVEAPAANGEESTFHDLSNFKRVLILSRS
jgi:hypothetical protein